MNIAVWILERDNKMKTLINKHNPSIRITAPEIEEITTLGYTNYEIARKGMFPLLFNPKNWTLVEEEPEKKKKNCSDCPHCVDRKDQIGWHFKGCFGGPYKGKFIAEIDECPLIEKVPTEGIKGNLEEIPSNVDLEKAAEEYADKHGFRVPYDGSNNFYDDVDVKASLEGFKAGARWMAEQIKGGKL